MITYKHIMYIVYADNFFKQMLAKRLIQNFILAYAFSSLEISGLMKLLFISHY